MLSHSKRYVEPPVPMNVTLLGNKVMKILANENKIIYWTRLILNSVIDIVKRRGNFGYGDINRQWM